MSAVCQSLYKVMPNCLISTDLCLIWAYSLCCNNKVLDGLIVLKPSPSVEIAFWSLFDPGICLIFEANRDASFLANAAKVSSLRTEATCAKHCKVGNKLALLSNLVPSLDFWNGDCFLAVWDENHEINSSHGPKGFYCILYLEVEPTTFSILVLFLGCQALLKKLGSKAFDLDVCQGALSIYACYRCLYTRIWEISFIAINWEL